jgi:hypothetical protein
MTDRVEESHHKGVICLFCGKSTSLSAQAEQRCSADPSWLAHRASLVRCHLCGKETLYLPEEIVDFQAA